MTLEIKKMTFEFPRLPICEGKPPCRGSFVAYIDDFEAPKGRYAKRALMQWDGSAWSFPFSSVNYRGTVYGWTGPLQAMELED